MKRAMKTITIVHNGKTITFRAGELVPDEIAAKVPSRYFERTYSDRMVRHGS